MGWLQRKEPIRFYSVGDRVETIDGRFGTITEVNPYECSLPYTVLVDEYNIITFFAERSVIRKIGSVEMKEANIAFSVGDVVTLRSGGPWMTVSQLNGSEIGCTWFSGDGDSMRREYFPDECLKKVEA